MKSLEIGVIGNCVSEPLANCLRLLRPNDKMHRFHLQEIEEREDERLKKLDYIFAVNSISDYPIVHERIHACERVVIWPNLVFSGLHPDCSYLDKDNKSIKSPLGDYNSLITAIGYSKKLDARETAELFNALVYRRLGFFDKFELSKAALVDAAAESDLDLADDIEDWARYGIFMHTINHPRLYTVASLAKALLRKCDLKFDENDSCLDILPDVLANDAIWPVYPEIAQQLNLKGTLKFKPPTHGVYSISCYGLEGFVETSFDLYRQQNLAPEDIAEIPAIETFSNRLAA